MRSPGWAAAMKRDPPRAVLPHAALKAPVTDSAALEALAAEVARRCGRCDLLVNCAGTTRFVAHPDLDAGPDIGAMLVRHSGTG